jgi:putative tryptophan/tyrosine transport system substrate-binding protein
LSGCGTKPQKVYRVGILSGLDFFSSTADGFKTKMAELGYVEGRNVVYEMHKTNFEPDKERQILNKFVEEKVDLILTFPSEVSIAGKAATQGTRTSLVFANALTENMGLIESVRQPGGNVTGVRYPGPDMTVTRFEVMRQLVPGAKRIWIPYQKGYPIVPTELEALRPVAASAGVTLVEFPAENATALQAELEARAKSGDIGIDAILCIVEPLTAQAESQIIMAKFASKYKIPLGGVIIQEVSYASLFGVVTDSIDVGREAAILAHKIFMGIPAGTIPVVSANNYLEINYKLAQELGIEVSEGLMSRASKIIR